ncbi:MAG: efflux RND transporter permease subunit [Nitrospirae bacterium]|nr:efflux RND transporter permease subunit [Nitrospirota bacterium]
MERGFGQKAQGHQGAENHTVLGVSPMIAGVSYDFHQMAVAWQRESTLWWRTMSTMVAAGLMVSTLLTLVVVPTVYALVENSKLRLAALPSRIKAWYWAPFKGRFGE